jgi:hypothetical protein
MLLNRTRLISMESAKGVGREHLKVVNGTSDYGVAVVDVAARVGLLAVSTFRSNQRTAAFRVGIAARREISHEPSSSRLVTDRKACIRQVGCLAKISGAPMSGLDTRFFTAVTKTVTVTNIKGQPQVASRT